MTETIKQVQKVLLAGGHVCSPCQEGIHMTCFGTCQCAYCQRLWEEKNSDEKSKILKKRLAEVQAKDQSHTRSLSQNA